MGQAAEKQETTALARDNGSAITGTFHGGRAIDARLEAAQRDYHLVSPFTAAGALPEGCGVQLTLVRIGAAETYPTGGGKFGLSKNALDRIGHAVGISWDPMLSRRLDDGRDPHYCHYKAVGTYRAADGQVQIIQGEKEFDVREGSPQLNGKTLKQIAEMRAHVLSHAETKARLRAIRSMGVATGYTSEDLQKPFACARVVFTGQTKNAELRSEFARMTAASFLGGSRALYGERPAALPAEAGHAPPPVGAVDDDEDDFIEATGETSCAAPRNTPPPSPPREQRAAGTVSRPAGEVRTVRLGKSRGTPIPDADDNTLEWYRGVLAENVANPAKARWRDENQADLDAVEAEIRRRNGEAEREPGDDEGWVE